MALTDSRFIAASDVAFELDGANSLIIATGVRKYILEATPEQAESLKKILTDIVPLLREARPLGRILSKTQLEELRPYLSRLISMGVILEAPEGIETESERKLFTFLSRRTRSATQAYEQAREHRFQLNGPEELVAGWRDIFEAQGLALASSELTRTISIELLSNQENLSDLSNKYHATGTAWVPVIIRPTGASIGPWVMPRETACPMCLASIPGIVSQPVGVTTDIKESWLSLQAGSLAWMGGLLVHSALRVVAPAGPHSPWGRRVDLDFLRIEHDTVSVWKDPYCAVCGPTPRPTHLWNER